MSEIEKAFNDRLALLQTQLGIAAKSNEVQAATIAALQREAVELKRLAKGFCDQLEALTKK